VGLIARVRALGRRAALPVPPMLYHGDIRLDPGSRAAFRPDGASRSAPRSSPSWSTCLDIQVVFPIRPSEPASPAAT
jgi:hypothetical protein